LAELGQDWPLFSIAIPTYNRAHLIRKTLTSIFEQTYTNYEIIIIDNCSQDNIKEVLENYIDKGFVKFIQHDQNYERATSRNTGMENATGDYLTLLDSDDIFYPQFLEDAAKFARNNPAYKVFHSLYNIVDEDGELMYKINFPPIDQSLSHIVNGNYLSCHGVFMAREVFENYRFDTSPDLIGHEDYEFWLRVLADHQLGRINKYNSALVSHRERSLKGFTIEQTMQQRAYVLTKFWNDPHLKHKYGNQLKRLNASFYLYAGVQSNFNYTFVKTFQLLRHALRTDFSILFTRRFWGVLRVALFRIDT